MCVVIVAIVTPGLGFGPCRSDRSTSTSPTRPATRSTTSRTSDRNFYDRYYFNMHSSSDELFVITGLGQYPNLGVTDAFITVSIGTEQHTVRASRELGVDRMDTSVGPLSVEVLEGSAHAARPLRRERVGHQRRPHVHRHRRRARGAAHVHPSLRPRASRTSPATRRSACGRAPSPPPVAPSTSPPTCGRARATARGACGPSASASSPASRCAARRTATASGTTGCRCSSTTTCSRCRSTRTPTATASSRSRCGCGTPTSGATNRSSTSVVPRS